MKNHNDYLDNISVDPVLHEKIIRRVSQCPEDEQKQEWKQRHARRLLLRHGAVAACVAAMLFAAWLIPQLNRNNHNPDYWITSDVDASGYANAGGTGNGRAAPAPEGSTADDAVDDAADESPASDSEAPRIFQALSFFDIEPADLIDANWTQVPSAVAVAQGANDFAFRLGAAFAEGIGYDNFVVSPYSVWMPLAALLNATIDEHQPALIEALGVSGISPEDINRAVSRMLFDLTNERARQEGWGAWGASEESALTIANAIFVDHNMNLLPEFAQIFMDYYRGEMISVDFQSPYAVYEVNRWASDNTNGLITDVVQEFDPLIVAAIANAIYFSARWQSVFDPEETIRDTFFSPQEESYGYFMRNSWSHILYFEDDYVQALDLPFSGGGGLKIILPKDGDGVSLLANMTSEYFQRMQNDAVLAEGTLLLPRFTIGNVLDNLTDILVALGVPLFDEQAAPLTGGILESDLAMWVSSAVQVAMIEVHEEGTTAAAVTMMDVAAEGLPPEPDIIFEMICNTPFVFVLHRRTTDGDRQVLFTGVVNQP